MRPGFRTVEFESLESRRVLAAVPEMIDINMVGTSGIPDQLVNVNGTLFFSANDRVHGRELWKSDGTETGTTLVKDISAGNAGSYPQGMTDVDGILYFTANDAVNGVELWKSDGTEAGTVMVKDIRPGAFDGGNHSSYPASLTNVDGTLFFSAYDGVHGWELWKSDGSDAGTVLVKDISPGGDSGPYSLTEFAGSLFFSANDGVHGIELWRSDGTESGTVMVRDIHEGSSPYGPSSSYVRYLTNVNGTLFFSAEDGEHGSELWTSDGTESGTVLVKDIRGDSPYGYNPGSGPRGFASVDGILFFRADDGVHGIELWRSDGTESGTVMVRDIDASPYSSYPVNLTSSGGVLFFTVGGELWKSDGSEAGTDRVAGVGAYGPSWMTDVDGTLYFAGGSVEQGAELWKSDGTESGTMMVKEINPTSVYFGPPGSDPKHLVDVRGTLFLVADNGTNGPQLWRSDGTEDGTELVHVIAAGSLDSSPQNLTSVGGLLYFSANDGIHGRELWRSDGTAGGSALVKDIGAGFDTYPQNLTDVNGTLFFTINDGINGNELWRSDGTDGGTHLVKDIGSGPLSSYPSWLTNVNGTLYFTANDGNSGSELWKSDGTESGTVMVKDINGRTGGSDPSGLTNVGGTLFFSARDGQHGRELWKSNGTEAGTILVKDVNPFYSGYYPYSSYPGYLTNVNGTLYFSADDGVHGRELWKSDGSAADTDLVRDLNSGASGSDPVLLTNVNGMLFFSAYDDDHGAELWKSDGTEAGTVLVKDIHPFGNSNAGGLTAVSGTLFFVADDGVAGLELWKSDGTESGTIMVKDIAAGTSHSVPHFLTNARGTLYFSATDDVHGSELWQSDGTESGTVMVTDVEPGFAYPIYLTAAADKLFFSADDGQIGRELWVLQLDRVNEPPAASADSYVVRQSGILVAGDASGTTTTDPNDNGVLANDSDPDGDPLTVITSPVSSPSHGNLVLHPDGTFVYSPAPGFRGTDTFVYATTDGESTATASVTITVFGDVFVDEQGNLVVNGTDRADRIIVSGSGSRYRVVHNSAAYDMRGVTGSIMINGGSGNDSVSIAGNVNRVSVVRGGDGNDRIAGGRGNDTLYGDGGNDVILGGEGHNVLTGGSGNDRLVARGGDDILIGGNGRDTLQGGSGRDLLIGGAGRDVISGGNGRDLLIAGWTAYDDDTGALSSVQTQWRNSATPLSQAVALLIAGVSAPPLKHGTSVFADDDRDTLSGGGGADWLLGGAEDGAPGRQSQDILDF